MSDDSRQKLNNLAKELSKIYPCEIHIHIAKDEIFYGLPIWRDNYLSYFRFFIPDFIPNNLKMCLYLDVDMLVLGDLRKLLTLDLGNQVAGITQDTLGCRAMKPISKNPQKEDFDFGDFYLNSGFLLMNLEQWRKQNIIKKVCDFLSNYRTIYHDQDALSAVLCNQTITLPLEYNCLTHIYYPSLFADFVVVNAKMPYSKEQVKFALENPIILHWAGDAKPYDCEFFRVNTKGDFIGLFWWQTAWNTPFFSDELKALFATKRDNYLVCKDFGLYVASLIDECSKGFMDYLKMPFVVYRAFSEFDLNRNYANDFSKSIDKNMAFELLSVAVRAWGRKNKLERIAKFAILPFRIYRTKNRCKKGIYKAQKGNVISRLYV